MISLWLETPKSKPGIPYLFYYKPFGHDVRFYPNEDIMNGFLKELMLSNINGYNIKCQSVGFCEAGKVLGVAPFEDTELNINGNPVNCIYTISFN